MNRREQSARGREEGIEAHVDVVVVMIVQTCHMLMMPILDDGSGRNKWMEGSFTWDEMKKKQEKWRDPDKDLDGTEE